jgi:hypothetical protein
VPLFAPDHVNPYLLHTAIVSPREGVFRCWEDYGQAFVRYEVGKVRQCVEVMERSRGKVALVVKMILQEKMSAKILSPALQVAP